MKDTHLQETPSQTLGPYFAIGLPWDDGELVVPEGTPGSFRIAGRVTDASRDPVPDALIETWQADPAGRFNHPDDPRGAVASDGFRGFARCPTDVDGRFGFLTVKPGPLPAPGGRVEAPHIDVSVLGRGLLRRLVTRVYFADEVEANERDPVLNSIEDAVARATLIAAPAPFGYQFDIRLHGDDETAFFDV